MIFNIQEVPASEKFVLKVNAYLRKKTAEFKNAKLVDLHGFMLANGMNKKGDLHATKDEYRTLAIDLLASEIRMAMPIRKIDPKGILMNY